MVWTSGKEGEKSAKKITEWKPMVFRPRGRAKIKWEGSKSYEKLSLEKKNS